MVTAVTFFSLSSAFWGWIVLGGGADWLEGTFLSAILIHHRAPDWPAGAIKVVGVLWWLASLWWFLLRIGFPVLPP
jgi:hypothetical protein